MFARLGTWLDLLSIGAAYGITVALFQWGRLSDLTGVRPAPTLAAARSRPGRHPALRVRARRGGR